jgi:CRP-like cAMP-binding protein/Fe-S-cluster-containing dehydrogenase component
MILGHRSPGVEFVPIQELRSHELFRNLPYKFLEYHDRTVVRRRYKAGDTVCEEGDYGATAFLIIEGEFEIIANAPREIVTEEMVELPLPAAPPPLPVPNLATWLKDDAELDWLTAEAEEEAPPTPEPAPSPPVRRPLIRTKEDVILGEMSCLSHHPRTATLKAVSSNGEMWEIRRNFLDALRRNRGSRSLLEKLYRERAVPDLLRRARLFADLPEADREAIVGFLQPRVEFVRVDPGQIVFEQGQPADHFYLVRLGFVKVARKAGEGEFVLDYLGPNTQFGEIGLLTSASVDYLKKGAEVILPKNFNRGTRTATVSALDDVELVRVKGEDFHQLARRFRSFRELVLLQAQEYLRKNEQNIQTMKVESLELATRNGLFNANSLLVLDLEKCTRCDECTRACADTHDGVSRLMRQGMRFGNFLVATSCRSCQNPYCMAGCPVDAIHRRPPTDQRAGLEIVIEPWCIGCGRCAQNCPYDNIAMHEYPDQAPPEAGSGTIRLKARPGLAARIRLAGRRLLARISPRFRVRRRAVVRAVTCDLCRNLVHKTGQEVACVYACPHDAAHRMSGPRLIDLVREGTTS